MSCSYRLVGWLRSRKFFCYNCCVPVPELCGRLPRLALPVAVDIVKHPAETDGKSTATHACVVAPDHAFIHTYPHFPDYGDQPGVSRFFRSGFFFSNMNNLRQVLLSLFSADEYWSRI